MTTPDENFGNNEDPILGINSTIPSPILEDFSSEDPDESPSPVPPDPLFSPENDTKRKPPCSRQLIQIFFNEHPVTKEVKDLDVLLYVHEDFLPSHGYLGHKPETFQSLLRIRSLMLQTPKSLAASWSHYQQAEPSPPPENLSKPFEQILVSLCQTIPSFHFTSPHLQDRQKEKTHLIHLSDEEAKTESPLFQSISLTLIIEKWIHQLTSTEKAFREKNYHNIRLEVSKTFLMADGILEIITILLRLIHPLLLNEINFQNKEAIKTRQQEVKTETKKDGDFLLQSFKEAFPFLTFKGKDLGKLTKDHLINPSQLWEEWVEINSVNIKNKTEMKKELALYEELLKDDWEVCSEEHTPDLETKDIHLLIGKHTEFIKNFNETFPWASMEIQNHLKTLFYLMDNPSLVSLLSGEFEPDKKWRSDQIPLSTLAFKNLGELVQKITKEGVFQTEKSEDQLTSFYPEDEAALISNIRKIENKVTKEIPTLLHKITSNSGIPCQDSFLILQGIYDLLNNCFNNFSQKTDFLHTLPLPWQTTS